MEIEPAVRRSYPLGALFVLVAAAGVISALLSPVVRAVVAGQVGFVEAVSASVGGALCGMVLGAVVGLYHYRLLRGLAWGTLTGGVIGMLVGPVVLAPGHAFGSLMTVSVTGAAALLISAAAFGASVKA